MFIHTQRADDAPLANEQQRCPRRRPPCREHVFCSEVGLLACLLDLMVHTTSSVFQRCASTVGPHARRCPAALTFAGAGFGLRQCRAGRPRRRIWTPAKTQSLACGLGARWRGGLRRRLCQMARPRGCARLAHLQVSHLSSIAAKVAYCARSGGVGIGPPGVGVCGGGPFMRTGGSRAFP